MFTWMLAFCAGAGALHALPQLLPGAALAALIVAALTWLRRRPLAGACLAGFLCAHAFAGHRLAGGWPCERDREEIELTGRVASPAFARDRRIDFELAELRSAPRTDVPRRARIAWYEAEATPRPGEVWRLTARLRCRRGLANPGAPDRELDLVRQRIDATG
jgi:predicted membrane metal-binding protein